LRGPSRPQAGIADAIIVAAGASERMGGTDKLLARIGGRPLLAYALAALRAAPEVASIVVVTTADRRRELEDGAWLPAGWAGGQGSGAGGEGISFVDGGERRQDSVRAGFEALEHTFPDADGDRVVLVHDGARPVVSAALVAAVVEAAGRHGAAIPVVPVAETLKRLDGDLITATVERSGLAAAQTPQGVRRGLLRTALGSLEARDGTWTDEAALLEACRIAVHVVPGDPANLKVTVPADLARAADLLAGPVPTRRSGIGHDAHPFGPGEPLRLGGIEISGAPRLHGHSDGDVVLHAVADALLGAAGLGDLGRLFPADASTPAGVDSRELLARVVTRLADAGWRPVGVDLTVVAHRPRLAAHLDAMQASLASHLGLDPAAVSVKASTGNLDGSEGAGRSISTLALATIEARA
jgi:2-C-methyl-D-erythritol 4-phosphate cytidylyltransferase / 2-C-methyl-D-erythritol 2,4-cyclodiphosphate synthase